MGGLSLPFDIDALCSLLGGMKGRLEGLEKDLQKKGFSKEKVSQLTLM